MVSPLCGVRSCRTAQGGPLWIWRRKNLTPTRTTGAAAHIDIRRQPGQKGGGLVSLLVAIHPMDSPRRYLTVQETAPFPALSTRTIRRCIAEGKLKVYRVGGEKTTRIKREDVDALLSPIAGERHVAKTADEHTRPRRGR